MKKIITVMCGWAFFISGILISEPTYYKVLLLSVARVLPSALQAQAVPKRPRSADSIIYFKK
jgi:hypothetical protein